MYEPHRDSRFEYIWELMDFIEENQCHSCAFRSDRPDYPMCFEVEAEIIEEKPVTSLDDLQGDGIVCRRYELVGTNEHPKLF